MWGTCQAAGPGLTTCSYYGALGKAEVTKSIAAAKIVCCRRSTVWPTFAVESSAVAPGTTVRTVAVAVPVAVSIHRSGARSGSHIYGPRGRSFHLLGVPLTGMLSSGLGAGFDVRGTDRRGCSSMLKGSQLADMFQGYGHGATEGVAKGC